ncbi:hypothetical protein GA0115240_14447 [Streptomyces sp. DvalAA-14]|nr:hypothetical protein GA0115240_14447 [Streptomyces sp. DvalAA-14]
MKATSTVPPAGTVTAWDTRTLPKEAATVICRSAVSALRTGTTIVTSALLVSGRSGRTVSTRGSPMTAWPVERSRTWFQMPATRSRTAGIQSQPEAARYVGELRFMMLAPASTKDRPSGPLSPGLPGVGIGVIRTASACSPAASSAVTSWAERANGYVRPPTCRPLSQMSAWWLTPSNSSQMCRPEPVRRPAGRRKSRRYHQAWRDRASGTRRLFSPATGSGSRPWSTSEVRTVPGTVAGSQPLVSTDGRDRSAPAPPAQSSMVSVQPDSRGTVPSAATRSAGGRWSCVPQSVQPVADGRWPRGVPKTSKPFRPSGLALERLRTVIRTQRATTGSASSISTTPPVPEVVRYMLVHVCWSREASTTKSTAQLDKISLPVVLSRGLPLVEGTKTGSFTVASKVRRTDSTSQSACRSTQIHCGSPSAARQPVPRTPTELTLSTTNSPGVGA